MNKVRMTLEEARRVCGWPERRVLRNTVRALRTLGDERTPMQDRRLEAAEIVLANYPTL